MKRDLDLVRELLLDLEGRGPDSLLTTLRSGVQHDLDERVRYHLRLLIDAGLVKEVERTTVGVPCVRLTHAGHELIELARSDARWREAKQLARQRTGGVSLGVVRSILARWAFGAAVRGELYDHLPPVRRPPVRRPLEEITYAERRPIESWPAEPELRLVRTRPDYVERFEWRDRPAPAAFDRWVYEEFDGYAGDHGASLPTYMF